MTTEYTLSDDPSAQQVDRIHAYLTRSYWAAGIPREIVQRSIEHSLCVGVFHRDAQVGFARVITDRATFAYLADVYVLEEHRGKGLASRMLQFIATHRDLQGLRRFMLATRDAHALYLRHGFTPMSHPDRFMEIVRANPYVAKT